MLSKCFHIAGVALVSRPEAKVSAARRKLKSLGRNGFGIGKKGSGASRSPSAAAPVNATASPRLRASRAKTSSTRARNGAPSRGQQNETATAISVRPPSISIREGPESATAATFIGGDFSLGCLHPHACERLIYLWVNRLHSRQM